MTRFNAPLHTDREARDKIWEMIKDIRIATLVTQDEDGRLYARPMGTHQEKFEGEIWLFTSINAPKVQAIRNNSHVLLSYSEPEHQNYVSINGTARVTRDRAKIHELWHDFMHTWFPEGKEDPDIALICIKVEEAEYWDHTSGMFVNLYDHVEALSGNERVLFQARR